LLIFIQQNFVNSCSTAPDATVALVPNELIGGRVASPAKLNRDQEDILVADLFCYIRAYFAVSSQNFAGMQSVCGESFRKLIIERRVYLKQTAVAS
jgi:hypothetical protein